MIVEILTNTYVLPLIAAIIGLLILFIYDKFEKKQYTYGTYFRIAILIYISTFAVIYLARCDFFLGSGNQSGGGIDPQSVMPGPNEIKTFVESFKTGIPTF